MRERRNLQPVRLNWRLEGEPLVCVLRKPFDVLAWGLVGAIGGSGEGKVTRLELFAEGVADLKPETRELIHAAA